MMFCAAHWPQYSQTCPLRRRWLFLKRLKHYYILSFDEALPLPKNTRVEGYCSTTKVPEEIGEIVCLHDSGDAPSAEHYYFSDGKLDHVYRYDGFLPTFLERKMGASSIPIENEVTVYEGDSGWDEHIQRFTRYRLHITNPRV